MEVGPGYKQTEVGVIPKDWTVEPVGQAFDIRNNLRLPIRQSVREKMAGPFPYYGPTGIQGYINEFRVEGEYALIGEDGDHFHKWKQQPMTLLVNGRFNVNNHAHLLKGTRNITAWFHYYFAHRDLTPYLTKQGAGRLKLTKSVLLQIPCAIPPTRADQQAIAEALSDADALIESLEQLIAKKRDLKSGAMQELLTGKKRLPGFEVKPGYKQTEVGKIPQDWHTDYIDTLAYITTGSRNTQDRVDDGQYPFFVRSQTVERINSYCFDGEAVLTAGDGVGTGKVFHYISGKFDAHQRVYRISNFNDRIKGYYFYLYFSNRFYNRIMQMTAKSSVDSVRREMIARMLIPFPSIKAEQTAIATVLSDMHAEIAALEEKLAKARTLKQGMMQELLTGRIRLV